MSKFLSKKSLSKSKASTSLFDSKENTLPKNNLSIKRQTIEFTKLSPEPRNFNCTSFANWKSDKLSLTSLVQNNRRAANATSFVLQAKFNRDQFSNALQEVDCNAQSKNLKAAAPIVMVSPLKQSDMHQFSQLTFNKERIGKSDRYDAMAKFNYLDSQGVTSSSKSNILSERTPKSFQTPAWVTSNCSDIKVDQDHNPKSEDEKCDTTSFKSWVLYDSNRQSSYKLSTRDIFIGKGLL